MRRRFTITEARDQIPREPGEPAPDESETLYTIDVEPAPEGTTRRSLWPGSHEGQVIIDDDGRSAWKDVIDAGIAAIESPRELQKLRKLAQLESVEAAERARAEERELRAKDLRSHLRNIAKLSGKARSSNARSKASSFAEARMSWITYRAEKPHATKREIARNVAAETGINYNTVWDWRREIEPTARPIPRSADLRAPKSDARPRSTPPERKDHVQKVKRRRSR